MTFDRDDAKIGLLVLFAAGLFVGLLFHRGMARLVAVERTQHVSLQNAADVTVGTEVLLQGVRIGKVNAVELQRVGVSYHVSARLGLRPDIVLWKGTTALVNSRTFGGGYLELQLPPEDERKEVLEEGSHLVATIAPSLSGAIEEVQNLVRNLNQSVEGLRTHIERKGLGALLDHPNVRKVLTTLDETLKGYDALAKDGQGILKKADPAMASLQRSLASVEKTTAVLEQRNGDIDALIASLARTLKEVEGFAGQLRGQMKTTLPETEETMKALHRNLDATEELLELLKQKPSRIVWGTPSAADKEAARKQVEAARKAPQK